MKKDIPPYMDYYIKQETMKDDNILNQLIDYFNNTPREIVEKEWHEYDKYNKIGITVKNYLKYIDSITKPKYPQTYEECCAILRIEYPYFKTEEDGISASVYKNKLIGNLKRLLICRDAYWKIAGGWKPDWDNIDQDKYVIYTDGNTICTNYFCLGHNILAFPTEEMRNAFYENFKSLIEKCKELL